MIVYYIDWKDKVYQEGYKVYECCDNCFCVLKVYVCYRVCGFFKVEEFDLVVVDFF